MGADHHVPATPTGTGTGTGTDTGTGRTFEVGSTDRTWLQVGMALLVGAFVASPALPETSGQAGLVLTLFGGAVLAVLLQRDAPTLSRARSTTLTLAGGSGALLLLSTSFGLVAADAHPWVVAPAVAAAGLVLALARLADRA